MALGARKRARDTRVHEAPYSYVMTSPGPDGHRHCTTVLEDGSGATAPARDGHTHELVALEVQPGGNDNHGHHLSAQRCRGEHVRRRHIG